MAFTSTLSRPMSWGTVEGKLIAYFCRKGWLGGIWDEISGISSNSLDSHPQNRRVNLVGLADPGGRAGRVIREGYHALESISAPTSSKNTLKAWTHLGTFAFRCLSCIVRHKKAGWSDRTRVSTFAARPNRAVGKVLRNIPFGRLHTRSSLAATRKRPYKAAKRQRPPLWQTISSTPGVLGGRGKDVLRADPLTIGPSDEIDQAGRGSSTADFSANRSDNG
jgi:hypothetical protein